MSELGETQVHKTIPGLMWVYRLNEQGGGSELCDPPEDLLERTDGVYWLHFQSDAEGVYEWLCERGFDSAMVDGLTANETRPRTHQIGNGTFIVLRGINKNPDADPEDMISLRIWATNHVIISARKKARRLLSVSDVRHSIDQGQGPCTPAEFIVAVAERLAIRIGEMVDLIESNLAEIEDVIDRAPNGTSREKLNQARKQTAALRRYLAPQRDALDTLYRNRNLFLEADAQHLREQAERITRYVEDLDLAREHAIVLHEELRNQISEQQNSRMYVLSLVTGVFLPLSFLTGVFGMNVAGLPGLSDPNAFTYLASGMVGLAIVVLIAMLWRRWL